MAVREDRFRRGGNPYPGLDSFREEDRHLFFGREDEANRLVSEILSSDFSLLYAESGVGKTSLLNAIVVPELERQGWTTVRMTPVRDPASRLRDAVLGTLLPDPRAEVAALDRALSHFSSEEALGDEVSLNSLRSACDKLKPADEEDEKRFERANSLSKLLAPVILEQESKSEDANGEGDRIRPHFCRLLDRRISVEDFADHLRALSNAGKTPGYEPVGGSTPVLRVRAQLVRNEKACTELALQIAPVSAGFVPLFQSLFDHYGKWRPELKLILILDQFEEVFTSVENWGARDGFLSELESLYRCIGQEDDAGVESPPAFPLHLPIRFVLSIRADFLGRLAPIRRFVPDLDRCSYHLDWLSKTQATQAVSQPAKNFGRPYSATLTNDIVKPLMGDTPFVKPAELQIVCRRLWDEVSVTLEQSGDAYSDAVARKVLGKLGGPTGILSKFLTEYLKAVEKKFGRAGRLDTIAMLGALVSSSRTRAFKSRSELLELSLLKEREDLLKSLSKSRIVREETRNTEQYVEVTHEHLIDAILQTYDKEIKEPKELMFREAVEALKQSLKGKRELTGEDYDSLAANRDRIHWALIPDQRDASTPDRKHGSAPSLGPSVTGLPPAAFMLRTAILANRVDTKEQDTADSKEQTTNVQRDAVAFWIRTLHEEKYSWKPSDVPANDHNRLTAEPVLMRVANHYRREWALCPEQDQVILHSYVACGSDTDQEDLRYWTRRVFHGR